MVQLQDVSYFAEQFDLLGPLEVTPFLQRGNINLDAFLVVDALGQTYLLQKINPDVFRFPERVMEGTVASLNAQRRGASKRPDIDWRVPKLVPTKGGNTHLVGHGVWRMQTFIGGVRCYKSLAEVDRAGQKKLAYEAGKGLAHYLDFTEDIDPSGLQESLPGYRNTRIYFNQLHSALAGQREDHPEKLWLPDDPDLLYSTEPHFYTVVSEEERLARRHDPELAHFIELALDSEALALELVEMRERGEIRQIAIHGDTKLENFLFNEDMESVALVDLDTVMPHSWLADWGDLVRSLCNVAGEREANLDNIDVDVEIYQAVKEGFLSGAQSPTPKEIGLMGRAVQVIALELGVRFLSDYLRGDTYFGVASGDPKDINKIRARGQLKLFERLCELENRA